MRYGYLDGFRHGISVFAIFSYGNGVLGTPQMSPSKDKRQLEKIQVGLSLFQWSNQKFFCRPEPTGLWAGYAPARLQKENNRVSCTD